MTIGNISFKSVLAVISNLALFKPVNVSMYKLIFLIRIDGCHDLNRIFPIVIN